MISIRILDFVSADFIPGYFDNSAVGSIIKLIYMIIHAILIVPLCLTQLRDFADLRADNRLNLKPE